MDTNYAKDLVSFLDEAPSQFHAVKEAEKRLIKNKFKKLDKAHKWKLEKGGKYYVVNNSSSVVAFEIGTGDICKEGFRLIGSHTDSPTFKIKPNPEMDVEGAYIKLNTEVYGGAILSTWFDRALSVAGRVSIKTKNPLKPEEKLVNIDKDLLVIPSLCIHMNREVNEGTSFNKQTDTLPLLSTINEDLEKDNLLLSLIAEELEVKIEDILDFELYIYDREKAKIIGMNDEFILAGKQDNLAMVHASLTALFESKKSRATKLIVANDNEEVGSMTKQGANSPMLRNIIERIIYALGLDKEDYHRAISNSFLISADMAHAVHPNYSDKSDPTNRPILNRGVVIKIAASQAYMSDAMSIGVYKAICQNANVPYQTFLNRSDMRGGTTIGPITSQNLDISTIDIGNPLLAMHSCKELSGVKDHEYMIQTFKTYFE